MTYYAVAHHGTAGLGWSFGYAEVVEGDAPHGDQTTTIAGPFQARTDAQIEADAMEAECARFRESQDAR